LLASLLARPSPAQPDPGTCVSLFLREQKRASARDNSCIFQGQFVHFPGTIRAFSRDTLVPPTHNIFQNSAGPPPERDPAEGTQNSPGGRGGGEASK
jgi:hypothetical protein